MRINSDTDTFNSISPAFAAFLPAKIDTATSARINTSNTAITLSPCLSVFSSILPAILTTRAMTPIAIATPIIITPALDAFFPANNDTATNATINLPKVFMKLNPFSTSSGFNCPIVFTTLAIICKAIAILRIILPALDAFFPASIDTATNVAVNIPIISMNSNPCDNSSGFMFPAILATITIISNAPAILRIMVPALDAFFPATKDTATNAVVKIPITAMNFNPCVSSSFLKLPANFATKAIIKSAPAILKIIFPASLALVPANLDIAIRLMMNNSKAPTNTIPFAISSHSSFPISVATFPIANKATDIPSNITPTLSENTPSLSNLLIATVRPISIPAKTPIAIPPLIKLFVSI